MKEKKEVEYINKHKKQARQFHPNAVVVPADRAVNAVERAYIDGVNVGVDAVYEKLKDETAISPIYLQLSPKDYE